MKKLIILGGFLFSACKKDYPNDIPKWLKDKINYYKTQPCYESGVPIISEYINTGNQEKLYVIKTYISMSCEDYYDKNGYKLCTYNIANCPSDSCKDIPVTNLKYSREIWHQDPSLCN